ncbi:MAG: ATP-binding protein, partial [Chloroflexi bacterium]|nr:ATP-binding protein [Chloroflexota bacterium]
MNQQTKFAEAEMFLAQGYYAQAVNTCGQVVEDLLRHLYQQVINSLPPNEAQRVLEVLQDIGKGKKVDELTLGQLDGLFRQADLSRKLDSVAGQRIQGLDNVRVYIDLRNQATHRGTTIERESAEAFLSHTRWLLSQIQAAAQPPRREVSVLSPWPQLARPHEDICKGRFDPDIFAAKLGDVLQEQATFDYQDPEAFFRRTYPTAGLRQLIQTVARRLTNRGGEGVIQLQTPFGGGKTHALLVLYHLFKHCDQVAQLESVQSLFGEITIEELPAVKVAAFVGTDADPEQGRTPWGELAAQLGDYEQLRVHDEKRVAPGKERLRRLLESRAPALLLIDELLEYVVKAAGVHIGEGTLKGQVLAFLQELTETVASLPRVSLILTLPSGLLERYDSAAEEAMAQLKHI